MPRMTPTAHGNAVEVPQACRTRAARICQNSCVKCASEASQDDHDHSYAKYSPWSELVAKPAHQWLAYHRGKVKTDTIKVTLVAEIVKYPAIGTKATATIEEFNGLRMVPRTIAARTRWGTEATVCGRP